MLGYVVEYFFFELKFSPNLPNKEKLNNLILISPVAAFPVDLNISIYVLLTPAYGLAPTDFMTKMMSTFATFQEHKRGTN